MRHAWVLFWCFYLGFAFLAASEPTLGPRVPVVTDNDNPSFSSGKHGFEINQDLPSDTLRQQWMNRGGNLLGKEAHVDFLTMSADGFKGVGFGYGAGLNWLHLTPPDPTVNHNMFFATKVGAAINFNVTILNFDKGDEGVDLSGMQTDLQLPFNFGGMFGIGAFSTPEHWRGVVLGANWQPTFDFTASTIETKIKVGNYSSDTTTTSSDTNINWGGMEYSLDFTTLDRALGQKFAKKSHFRLAFFYLPPMGDSNMQFMMFKLGLSWY